MPEVALSHVAVCPQYKILLYSLDGRLLATYCAYEWALGIKSVAWSPSSQFLAVGSYDGKVSTVGLRQLTTSPWGPGLTAPPSQVRILNHVTWKVLTELEHPATIHSSRIVSKGA